MFFFGGYPSALHFILREQYARAWNQMNSAVVLTRQIVHVARPFWHYLPTILFSSNRWWLIELLPMGGMRSRYALNFKKAPTLFLNDTRTVLQIIKFGQIVNSTSYSTRTNVALPKYAIYRQVGCWLTSLFWGSNTLVPEKFQLKPRWQKTISNTCLAKGARGVSRWHRPL